MRGPTKVLRATLAEHKYIANDFSSTLLQFPGSIIFLKLSGIIPKNQNNLATTKQEKKTTEILQKGSSSLSVSFQCVINLSNSL